MIKTRKSIPSQHLIINALRKLAPTTNSAPRLKQQKQKIEATMNMRLYGFKYETVFSLDIKLSVITSNKPSSCHDQPSADIIKWQLLKLPGKYSHASQFTIHLSSMTLEVKNLLQIQKLWDSIRSDFCQYLSTNKRCKA